MVDGHERVVAAGEVIDIPRGVVHQVRNAGDVQAIVIWQTRPALRTDELCTAAATEDWERLGAALTSFDDVFVLVPDPVRADPS